MTISIVSLNNLNALSMKTADTKAPVFLLFMVKLGFKDQSVSNQLIRGRRIIDKMEGNPRFTSPSPSLAELTVVTNKLAAAEAAIDRSRIKTEQRNTALKVFTAKFKQLQTYVEATANGSSEAVLSSGFELRNHNTRSCILPAPVGVKAGYTDLGGEIKVRWKPVKGKEMYSIEIADDLLAGNWKFAGYSTKAKLTVANLEPGKLYGFRVAVINPAGISAWSETARGRANY